MKKTAFAMLAVLFLVAVIVFVRATTPADIVIIRDEAAVIRIAQINATGEYSYLGLDNFLIEDFNGDNTRDIAIGGYGTNLSGGEFDNTGLAYIFYGNTRGFSSLTVAGANVTINGTSPGYFGRFLVSGDFNNDSIIDLIISASSINLSGGDMDNWGQVYIFYGNSNGFGSCTARDANITINGTYEASFGISVLAADLNNDSYSDLAIGAYAKNLSGGQKDYAGQAHIFYRSSNGAFMPATSAEANVTLNGTSVGDFGSSIAAADFNNDSLTDLAVGAYAKNISNGAADNTGQVSIFYGSSDGMHSYAASMANVTLNGTGPSQFGWSLLPKDLNSDGVSDLAVGAINGSGNGQAHIFYGSPILRGANSNDANVTINETSPSQFGYSFASADLNRDGIADLVIGANMKNPTGGGGNYQGMAYVFYGSGSGLWKCNSSSANITLNGTSAVNGFGASIAVGNITSDGITGLAVSSAYMNTFAGSLNLYTFNFPPTLSAIPNQNWNEDSSITINLSAYFSDVNRDELNYTWVGNTNIALSIDESTNIVTLTPNANWYGTEYVMFYANDSYNDLVASNNITLAVSNTADCGDNTCDSSESCTSCASDCGVCPAVSGSSSTIAEPKAAHTFTIITPEKPAAADFKGMAVSSITLTTDETANNVRLEVKEILKTDVAMPETGVYKLIEIKASNIELKEAKIKFKVKLSWLEENDVEQGEVVLMHHKDSWKKLKTAYTGKDDENAYYEAKTGSLSMFAISYQKKEEIKEEPVQEELKQEEKAEIPPEPAIAKEEPAKQNYALWASFVILLLAAIILLLKRKKPRRK